MAATERLIVAQAGSVSTRAIADAAGIAEGTIFRVFPTKETIIEAIFEDAFDRSAFFDELAGVSADAPLEVRMEQVVAMLQRRIRRIMALFGALGFRRPPGMGVKDHKAQDDLSLAAIAAVLEPDRDRFRVAPLDVARLMQTLGIALSMPLMADRPEHSAAAVVDLILNGVARNDDTSAFDPPTSELPAC